MADQNQELLPDGYAVRARPAGSDDWMFRAAGVPTINFRTFYGWDDVYHSQYMTAEKVDWAGAANAAKILFRVVDRLDQGVLPYDLSARADDLATTVVPDELKGAGASASAVDTLQADIDEMQRLAVSYEAAQVPRSAVATVNGLLLKMQKVIGTSFTALDAYDATIYPHQQVLWDVEFLNAAIAALQHGQLNKALGALGNVGLTPYGLVFSHDVYTYDLSRRDPDYYRVNWGEQGHLVHYLDVIPQYRSIQAGTWNADTVAQLEAMRAFDLNDLDSRLKAMSEAVQSINDTLKAIDKLL
jgi:hypothetical protein